MLVSDLEWRAKSEMARVLNHAFLVILGLVWESITTILQLTRIQSQTLNIIGKLAQPLHDACDTATVQLCLGLI